MISTLWKNTGITIAKDMLARSVVRTTECVIQSLLFVGGWGWRGVRGESPGTFELLFETICLGETVIELFILHMVLKSSVPLSYRPVFPLILSAHPRRSKFLPNVNVDMTTCYSLISGPKSGHSFPPLSLKKIIVRLLSNFLFLNKLLSCFWCLVCTALSDMWCSQVVPRESSLVFYS